MKTGGKVALIIVAAAVVVAGGFYLRGRLTVKTVKAGATGDPVGYTVVKVSRGDIISSVTASGQFQPNTITTIRPDSNMPTRKLVKLFVQEGNRVKEGEPLAEVDPSGLDLSLQSAQANYDAQVAKLNNLKAKPDNLDLVTAEGDLTQAKVNLDTAQATLDSTKALADKGLASRNQLSDAQGALNLAKTRYQQAQLSYQNVKAQTPQDVLAAQQSAVTQAQNDLLQAKLIWDSVTVRSPAAGVVAEVLVNVGDLVSPSTALMTVIDPDPMVLEAQVNENDMVQVKVGDPAVVTPSGYPDMQIPGAVTGIDLHATVSSNVSVFTTSISVPNHDGKLLWGMNADTEISVLSLRNVLTLPTSAIKTTSNGTQVTIIDGGQLVSWDVQTGATDGTRTQIVAGLDEGQEVVGKMAAASSGGASNNRPPQRGGGGFGPVFQVFR